MVVLGDGQIEFEDVYAVFDGEFEGGDGVFRTPGACSAMAVYENGLCRDGFGFGLGGSEGGDGEEKREGQGGLHGGFHRD